jgi:hypothetical protein
MPRRDLVAAVLCALPDARRTAADTLERDVEAARRSPVVAALLDAVDGILLILNPQRQIVAANAHATRTRELAELLGMRPGEAFHCVNASGPGGCGAAPECAHCGSLGAILASVDANAPAESECLMRTDAPDNVAQEFNVRATPIDVDRARFTAVSLRDVAGEKRREILEHLFLHDVLNTVAGLRGWVSRLRLPNADAPRVADRLELLSRRLEREIRDHRALVHAEEGTLVPEEVDVPVAGALADLDALFASHALARTRRLVVEPVSSALALRTDPALLQRVLANMVSNALEATAEGGVVRVGCAPVRAHERAGPPGVRFTVHNDGVIPAAVQARIFQRSFSTKAARGRGLGTYGMKLLGERVLGGAVSFSSSAELGTAFSLVLPLEPDR